MTDVVAAIDAAVSERDDVDRFYIEIGRRVRTARTSITQADLARALDLTRSSVANLEAGRQRIPLHTFLRLAEALGVEPSDLLPGLASRSTGSVVDVDISDEPESTQEFIRGALASLGLSIRSCN